jgi:hypothetical protein
MKIRPHGFFLRGLNAGPRVADRRPRRNRILPLLVLVCAAALACSKTGDLFPGAADSSAAAPTHAGRDTPPSVPALAGEWTVRYSWGCGTYSETGWNLSADGTFYSASVNRSGKWILRGRDFVLTFPYAPFVVYSGTVSSDGLSMEGTMAGNDGSRGCWDAAKIPPAAPSAP